ncbi:MAG: hypothetical protein ACLTQI_07505 [Slackia sp.]
MRQSGVVEGVEHDRSTKKYGTMVFSEHVMNASSFDTYKKLAKTIKEESRST